MDRQSLEDFKLLLDARLIELDGLAESGSRAAEPVELDQTSVGWVSRIDAIQNQVMPFKQEENRRNERAGVEAALRRIKCGDFGICLVCGGGVALRRLEFDPAIPTSIGCARSSG